MWKMTQSTDAGGSIGAVNSLRRLAAKEVAKHINFRPDEYTGGVHGDPHMYRLVTTDPQLIPGMLDGRSVAISKHHANTLRAKNDEEWWWKAERALKYKRPFGKYARKQDYNRLRQVVSNDVTMDKYIKEQNPTVPDPPSQLAHFMFPDERWGKGRPPVYPPQLNNFLLHRIHGYPVEPRPGFDPVLELRQRYSMTNAQAKVALQETYLDFVGGHSP